MLPVDTTQIVLLAVIIVLTIFLVVISFQVFFVLKDLRKTLFRLNRLFDDADDLVGQVKKPIESAGNIFTAMTAGVGIADLLKRGSSSSAKASTVAKAMADKSQDNNLATFIAGVVIGAALTYLFATKNGQKIKEQFLKDGTRLLEKMGEGVEEGVKKLEEAEQSVEEG